MANSDGTVTQQWSAVVSSGQQWSAVVSSGLSVRSSIRIVHAELAEANEFVTNLHRHHKKTTGHRFSLKAVNESGATVGVAIVGRPVARMTDQIMTVEVTRLCTDGTKNACSALYGAAARAAKELGYARIQTFILESETGTSLKAAGWERGHTTAGGSWDVPSRPRDPAKHPTEPKVLWTKRLA